MCLLLEEDIAALFENVPVKREKMDDDGERSYGKLQIVPIRYPSDTPVIPLAVNN